MFFIEKTAFEKKSFSLLNTGCLFLPFGLAVTGITLVTFWFALSDAQMHGDFSGIIPFILFITVACYFCLKRVRIYNVFFGIYPSHITINNRDFRWASIQYIIIRPAGLRALYEPAPRQRAGAYPVYPQLAARGYFEAQFNFREGPNRGIDYLLAVIAVALGAYVLLWCNMKNPSASMAPVGVLGLMMMVVLGVNHERPCSETILIAPQDFEKVSNQLQFYSDVEGIVFRFDYELHFLPPETPREQSIPRLKNTEL